MDWLALGELSRVAEKWTLSEHFAATIVELLDDIRRILVVAHSDPKKKPQLGEPIRFDRPEADEEDEPARPVTMRDLMRSLNG